MPINQLSVFDDYIRHGDLAEFCVMMTISVMCKIVTN